MRRWREGDNEISLVSYGLLLPVAHQENVKTGEEKLLSLLVFECKSINKLVFIICCLLGSMPYKKRETDDPFVFQLSPEQSMETFWKLTFNFSHDVLPATAPQRFFEIDEVDIFCRVPLIST